MFEVDAAQALLGGDGLRLAQTKFGGFVGSDVEERTGELRDDLAVNLANEIVVLGLVGVSTCPWGVSARSE